MVDLNKDEMESRREHIRRFVPKEATDSLTQGANHIAVYCGDLDATAQFYTEIMGMPLINVMDNRDVPESTHMNIDIGGGMALSFFDFPHIPRLTEFATEGVGNVMHIALEISRQRYAEIKQRLDDKAVPYEEVGGSIYVRDPNRLNLELLIMD